MSDAYTDHADFYRRGPFSKFLVEHRSAGSAPVNFFAVAQPAGEFPDPAFPNILLYLARRGTREARFDWGAGRWRGRWRTGDLTLVPPNSASDVSLSDDHAFLGLCIPNAAALQLGFADGGDPAKSLLPLFERPFRDRFTTQLLEQAWIEASNNNPNGSLFADGMVMALLARLGVLGIEAGTPQKIHALPPQRLARVSEYIDANLGADLSVADLAGVADMSAAHFSRQFRQATGMPPYRYVLATRLDFARDQLVAGFDIVSTAVDAGFSSQSHFTTQFHRRFGITPAKLVRHSLGDGSGG